MTEEEKKRLRKLIAEFRRKHAGNTLHACWDVCFDAEAHLAGRSQAALLTVEEVFSELEQATK